MKTIICGAGDVGYSIADKLSNENFIKRAPRTVIEKEKSNFDKLTKEMKKINHNLNMLS